MSSITNPKTKLPSPLNANTLDGLSSTQFVRNDQVDQKVTGSFKGDGSQLTNLPSSNIPDNLSVITVTASAGFKGDLTGTASNADKLDGINSTEFAILTASNIFTNTNIISGSVASGAFSHAEGGRTEAHGDNSHAEGSTTKAYGYSSHAEGLGTIAYGDYSHSEGFDTIASASHQHVQGILNQTSSTALMLIGNGDQFIFPFPKRSNIFEVYTNKVVVSGSVNVTDLQSNSTRAVYADSTGKLTAIDNTYTYDTVNRNATYKATISGSAGNIIQNLFFTTDTGKGTFIPSNCMFFPTSGDNTASPYISVGLSGSGFPFNDLAVNSSVGSMTVGTEFIEIPLQTPNGSSKCKAVGQNTGVWWRTQNLNVGTQITGTLVLAGYYLGV